MVVVVDRWFVFRLLWDWSKEDWMVVVEVGGRNRAWARNHQYTTRNLLVIDWARITCLNLAVFENIRRTLAFA